MKCPAPERIAELAAEGSDDDDLLAHLADCADCRALVDAQREVRDWLAEPASTPPLSRPHREALAAEVLARADMLGPAIGRRAWRWGAVAMAAAAAVVAAMLAWPRAHVGADVPGQSSLHEPAASAHVGMTAPDDVVGTDDAPALEEPAQPRARVEGTGEFSRAGDVVSLTGGDVTVDAPRGRAVAVVTGDTAVRARAAKVKVVAVRGAISQVSVFAGSAEITIAGKTVIVEQGMTWSRPDAGAVASDAAEKFRAGWTALRAGNNAEAVADFDEATDDDVAEDALYWSAVASERRKDKGGALRRYRQLVESFPKSPRIEAATAAIARLDN